MSIMQARRLAACSAELIMAKLWRNRLEEGWEVNEDRDRMHDRYCCCMWRDCGWFTARCKCCHFPAHPAGKMTRLQLITGVCSSAFLVMRSVAGTGSSRWRQEITDQYCDNYNQPQSSCFIWEINWHASNHSAPPMSCWRLHSAELLACDVCLLSPFLIGTIHQLGSAGTAALLQLLPTSTIHNTWFTCKTWHSKNLPSLVCYKHTGHNILNGCVY